MDWNYVRAYLMVAKHGSTLAAAKHLGVTQSTVSRHLSELENQLSVQLFDRKISGLELTDKGKELLSIAQRMEPLAGSLQAQASHYSSTVTGTVRVSANETIAVEVLPRCLIGLLDENPDLQIEIIASIGASNLLSREADIAIRMFEPTQLDLVSMRLPDVAIGFFAHTSYLDKFGRPETVDDLKSHRLIGFDLSTLFVDGARKMGIDLNRENFPIRSDAMSVQTGCVRAGAGISVMQLRLAHQNKGLEQVNVGVQLPVVPMYLVARKELRVSRKLRVVYESLATELSDFYQTA